MARLQDDEIAHYRREGWVVPRYRLPAERVARMVDALEALLRANPGVRPEKLVSAHIEGDNGEGVRGSRAFLDLARDPEIVELVSGVLGEDVILWGCHVFCKPAVEGYETPWHQDGEYWPMRPLATCSVWIALDPVSAGNGCMRFIPGSHKQKELYRHHVSNRDNVVLNLELDQDQFDEAQAVNVELEPGQMSLHDVRLIHGSLANASGQRRAALIMRYMPATSHYDRSLVTQRRDNSPFNIFHQPLWLMRGVDRSGKNDFVHGHAQWRERYARGLAPVMESEG